MARDSSVTILYRIAEKGAKNKNKIKPAWINNKSCLENLVKHTNGEARIVVFGDNLKAGTAEWICELPVEYIETKAHGNSETFLEVYNYALDLAADDIVYFVEDDYLHRPGFISIIKEGLNRVDYVSLYDHPDKYGGNPTRLFVTESSHWQFVPSTTMTFAAKASTLVFDEDVFTQAVTTGNPPDHLIFSYLTGKMGRRLATPIPGFATHGETAFLAPIIDWERLS